MPRPLASRTLLGAAACFILIAGCTQKSVPERPTRYEDLTALFQAWRNFEKPPLVDDVHDYSANAMAAQHRELVAYQQRLAAIDTTGWPISQRIDYHLVKAEMNGLDFDHRVRKPWANNPAFYVMLFPDQSDTPGREGPVIHGAIDLWKYPFPLSATHAAELSRRLRAIPKMLEQAKGNLTGNGRDLWIAGIRSLKQQSDDLGALADKVVGSSQTLIDAIRSAREATDAFSAWLEQEAPNKNGPSGVGVENYNWYSQNVQLVPFTWQEEVTIMRRELARAHAALRLEEHRNRKLPPLEPIATAAEYDRRLNEAVTEYMAFLREQEVVSIRDYMDAALRERIGRFSPASNGRRMFFAEVNYRDPVVMRTHGYHWFDLARMKHEPHASPIRRVPLLSNIFVSRAEGLATGVEEMMMHVGLFDKRPRARELIWVLLAQRAARALGGLHLHSNEWTMEQAVKFAAQWTPRGWLAEDSDLAWFEQHLYLQQPMYGSSYITGKIQIEQLLAERSRQLGEAFTLKRFMDELNAAGMIPVSLIRWEMTGEAVDLNWSAAAR
ncbi:MAG: DUF885 domain-containing protein [candidate division KSB1 bacterium]|nr:DUF885 domain-containing protein [candidate division KSB1 bacterium]